MIDQPQDPVLSSDIITTTTTTTFSITTTTKWAPQPLKGEILHADALGPSSHYIITTTIITTTIATTTTIFTTSTTATNTTTHTTIATHYGCIICCVPALFSEFLVNL